MRHPEFTSPSSRDHPSNQCRYDFKLVLYVVGRFFARPYVHVILQDGKGDGEHDEDDAVIAGIRFGGPKVRRLADAEDSSDGDGSATGADDFAVGDALPKGKGAKGSSKGSGSKGKGKKRATSSSSDTEGTHKFQPVPKSGASPSGTGGVGEVPGASEDDGGGVGAASVDAPGSMLVSAIEAQAKREADRAKAAAAESTGTKIVVKQKKRRDKGGGEGVVDGGGDKKRKKHKRKDRSGGDSKKNGSVKAAAAAPAPVSATAKVAGAGEAELGGLNLLGSYASSSGSEGDAP